MTSPLIYAHRGASAQYAEHTRAAFAQALTEGADGIECDIQLSADGVPVLMHDSSVDRTSNATGPVGGYTLAQLRALDFSSWKNAEIDPHYGGIGEQFMSLQDLLDLLTDYVKAGTEADKGAEAGTEVSQSAQANTGSATGVHDTPQANRPRSIGLAVEFKHSGAFDPAAELAVLELLARKGWDQEQMSLGGIHISMMSFEPRALQFLAEQLGWANLCSLFEGPLPADSAQAGILGPSVLDVRADESATRAQLAQGKTLRVWTVDDPEDARCLRDLGVQELTTNKPALIREALV